MTQKFLLLILGLVMGIVIVEVGHMALFPGRPFEKPFRSDEEGYLVSHPIFGWRNKPGFARAGVTINSRGYRGPEVLEPRPDGPRIVMIGDSATFGLWVEGTDDALRLRYDGYVQAMQTLAASWGVGEVINTGANGYDTSHALRLMATEVVDLAPDIVVVRLGVNDHRLMFNTAHHVSEPENPFLRAALYAFYRLRVVGVLLEAWAQASVPPAPGTLRAVPPDRFEHNVRRLIEIARGRGIRLLLVDTPLRPLERGEARREVNLSRGAGYKSLAEFHEAHQRYQDGLKRVAVEEGIPFLDTRSLLRDPERSFFTAVDFVHPNREGAHVLGVAVLEELERLGWIPGRSS